MNREETAKILSFVKANYIGSFKEMSREEMNLVLASWENKFKNIPADIVFAAVNEIVGKRKFPPSVADVAEHLVGMYWDNLLYFSGIKHGTILLSEADKRWVLYLNASLENFARNMDQTALTHQTPQIQQRHQIGGHQK